MKFKDLRDFVQQLEQRGELKRIQVPISPVLEMTEICDRTLRNKGPALLKLLHEIPKILEFH